MVVLVVIEAVLLAPLLAGHARTTLPNLAMVATLLAILLALGLLVNIARNDHHTNVHQVDGNVDQRSAQANLAKEEGAPNQCGGEQVEENVAQQGSLHQLEIIAHENAARHHGGDEDARPVQFAYDQAGIVLTYAYDGTEYVRRSIAKGQECDTLWEHQTGQSNRTENIETSSSLTAMLSDIFKNLEMATSCGQRLWTMEGNKTV